MDRTTDSVRSRRCCRQAIDDRSAHNANSSSRRRRPRFASQNIDADRRSPSLDGWRVRRSTSRRSRRFRCASRTSPFPRRRYDTYDAHLNAQQPLLTPTSRRAAPPSVHSWRRRRRNLRVTLFALRQEVNDAFFTALLLQEREAQIIVDDRRPRRAASRNGDSRARGRRAARRHGGSSPRRFCSDDRISRRRARIASPRSRDSPSSCTKRGSAIRPRSRFPIWRPWSLAPGRRRSSETRARPEYAQFEATRARLAAQRPCSRRRIARALARSGGSAMACPDSTLASGFQSYFLGGLPVRMDAVHLGHRRRANARCSSSSARSRRRTSARSRTQLAAACSRSSRPWRGSIPRSRSTTASSRCASEIERETAAKLREGVDHRRPNTSIATSELLAARLASAQHRVELAQARADYLNTARVWTFHECDAFIDCAPLVARLLASSPAARHQGPDAYGNVEATEVVVGSQAAGQLESFTPNEGQRLSVGRRRRGRGHDRRWFSSCGRRSRSARPPRSRVEEVARQARRARGAARRSRSAPYERTQAAVRSAGGDGAAAGPGGARLSRRSSRRSRRRRAQRQTAVAGRRDRTTRAPRRSATSSAAARVVNPVAGTVLTTYTQAPANSCSSDSRCTRSRTSTRSSFAPTSPSRSWRASSSDDRST